MEPERTVKTVAERDAHGRFMKGTTVHRPKGSVGKSYRRLLRERLEATKVEIIEAMEAAAKMGDVRAAEWLAKWETDPSTANLELATTTFTLKLSTPERDSDEAD